MAQAQYILLLSGVGGGKTYAGAERFVKYLRDYPQARGMICTPKFQHLRKAVMPVLRERCQEYNIKFKANYQTKTLSWENTEDGCVGESDIVSLKDPDNARGPTIDYIWIDEASYISREAWDIVQGRLRGSNVPDNRRSIWMTATPNGFDWTYDLMKNAGSDWKNYQKKLLLTCASTANTFLPAQYLQAMHDNYDSKFLQQEVYAQWINISEGAVFYAFQRHRNLVQKGKRFYDKEFYVAIDFNVSPFCCSFWQENIGGQLTCIDSIELLNADTYQMCAEIKDKTVDIGLDPKKIRIYPDPAAKQRRTSAKDLKTDLQILLDNFPDDSVYCSRIAIPIKASATVVNKMLEDSRLFVENTRDTDPVVNSLERSRYITGSNFAVSKLENIEHHGDAVRYMCYLLKYDTPMSIGYGSTR